MRRGAVSLTPVARAPPPRPQVHQPRAIQAAPVTSFSSETLCWTLLLNSDLIALWIAPPTAAAPFLR